jgi:hypothetical protein
MMALTVWKGLFNFTTAIKVKQYNLLCFVLALQEQGDKRM